MKLSEKIGEVFCQFFMLLLIPIWICFEGYVFCFGLGIFLLYFVMARIKDLKRGSFVFFEDNWHYGGTEILTHTVSETQDIRSDYGVKVGSIVSHKKESYTSEDSFKYSLSSKGSIIFLCIIYCIAFPFLRIISFFASIVALFTDKFYVKVAAPQDYTPQKYNQFLHCWLDIVYVNKNKSLGKLKEKYRRSALGNIITAKIASFFKSLTLWHWIMLGASTLLVSVGLLGVVVSVCWILCSIGNKNRMREALKLLIVSSIPTLIYVIVFLILICNGLML